MIDEGEITRVIKGIVAIDIPHRYVASEDGTRQRITQEQGEDIARLFHGSFELFRELDESPGRYTSPWYHGIEGVYSYNGWHWKLRQARNSCELFFEIIANDKSEREAAV